MSISSRCRRLRARVAPHVSGLTVLLVAGCLLPAVASAGSDHWFSGALSPGLGYSSASAHSSTQFYVEGQTDHNTFCVAVEQGTAGSHLYTWYGADSMCATSGGFANGYYTKSGFWHGTIENYSGSLTNNVASSTHYSW